MYETSELFKMLATDSKREDKAYVTIDGIQYDDGPQGRLDSIKYDFKSDSFIGGFSAASVIVALYYDGISETEWAGKVINVFAGFEGAEYIPVGSFLIPEDGVETDETARVVTLTAYDAALQFDQKYQPLTLPATGREIMQEIALWHAIAIDESSQSLPFDDYIFNEINIADGETISYRQIINQYAQLNLSVAYITREGKLKFKSVLGVNSVFEVDAYNYVDASIESICGPVNSLVYEQGDVEDPVYAKDDESIDLHDLTQITMSENIFMSLLQRGEQQDIINMLFAVVHGFRYTPFDIQGYNARPDIDPFDSASIYDTADEIHVSPVSNISWEYLGTLEGVLNTEVLPETITDYTLSGTEQDLINMGIKVDRVDQNISLYISKTETLETQVSEQSSSLVILDNKIQGEVADRKNEDENITAQVSSTLTQLSNSFEVSFSKIENNQQLTSEEINELKTYFRWDENGAIIGKSGNPIELYQSNNRIEFRENGVSFAYWEGGTMSVDRIIAQISIVIGTHLVEKYNSPVVGNSTLIRQVN